MSGSCLVQQIHSHCRRTIAALFNCSAWLLPCLGFFTVGLNAAHADNWNVTIRVHEVEALTNSDASGEQDMYWRVSLAPVVGSGAPVSCDTEDNPIDDNNHPRPKDWACTIGVSGGSDTVLRIKLELWDYDSTSGDDELGLNPDPNQLGLDMRFEPSSSKLMIIGVPEWSTLQCAAGRIHVSGLKGKHDEPADIWFSVTASPVNAVDGDSDGDGLLDSWEVCGLPNVNLPAMGAD